MRQGDPALVRAEYQNESRLVARKAAYEGSEGPDAREVLFTAIAEATPRKILDVGCGEGELAERLQGELGGDVVASDQSERMVELTRRRGVDARLGRAKQPEFAELIGHERIRSGFVAEDADADLARHFRRVERRNAHGRLVFRASAAAQAYVDSLVLLEGARVPAIGGPIRVRRQASIFVAEKA